MSNPRAPTQQPHAADGANLAALEAVVARIEEALDSETAALRAREPVPRLDPPNKHPLMVSRASSREPKNMHPAFASLE